jgi:hypothetical protein
MTISQTVYIFYYSITCWIKACRQGSVHPDHPVEGHGYKSLLFLHFYGQAVLALCEYHNRFATNALRMNDEMYDHGGI